MKRRGKPKISTKMLEIRHTDNCFIHTHVYRTPRKIDMGPIVAAALEAVCERRWRRVV